MLSIEIDNSKIAEKYSKSELNYLFSKMVQFLENEEQPVLYQVDITELSEQVKKDIETPDEEIEYINF